MNLKIDDLLLLAEVQRAGSLSAAARALAWPKATLSRHLAALEAAVGTRVFVPGARRLQLTEFGTELAERASRHREEIEETRAWIGARESRPRGRLRISVPADFAIALLAEPMARFVQRHPEVTLEVDTTPRRVDLLGEAYDLVVRVGALEDSSLVARRLMLLERGLYASPLYLAQQPTPRAPAQLREHRFVLMPQAAGKPPRLQHGRRSVELATSGALQCNSIGLARALVLAGGGLGAFPHGLVRDDVAAGRLLAVLPQWHLEPLPVSLLTAGRKLMPAKLRAFIDHLAEVAPGWSL
jgi:DNA-binding transcriptional LysR family regulator